MKYITLKDLTDTIRNNIQKVPRDIDFIIGVPRSGMIAASIISSYLNVPLISIQAFVAGLEPTGGSRLQYFNNYHQKTNRALVIDDTVYGGTSMNNTRNKLSYNSRGMSFVYMCVYLEGHASQAVDIYLEDIRQCIGNDFHIVLYEWNIFQHHSRNMSKFLFDIDGVFCVEPPDERNEEAYLQYIENATPLFIPRTRLGGIVTYRLEKNRSITERWFASQGITYNELIMFPALSWDERHNSRISSEQYKAAFYQQHDNYKLFIESSDYQAQQICKLTGKPVYCVETNKMYL